MGTTKAWGTPAQALCQGFSEESLWRQPGLPQYLPFSFSTLVSSRIDMNFSSSATLFLYLPDSRKSKWVSGHYGSRHYEESFTKQGRIIKPCGVLGSGDGQSQQSDS